MNGAVLSLCCPSPVQKEVGWYLMWALKNSSNSQQELEGTESPMVPASSPFPLLGFCSHREKGFLSLFCVSEQFGEACAVLSPMESLSKFWEWGWQRGGRWQQSLGAAQVCCQEAEQQWDVGRELPERGFSSSLLGRDEQSSICCVQPREEEEEEEEEKVVVFAT